MLSVVDCIFIASGFLLCAVFGMLIMLIRSFRRAPSQYVERRAEPVMQPQLNHEYAVSSPWDASMHYEGFTGVIHVHGVKSGDTFRAVVTDNNSKCRLEKMVRVRG